MFMRRNTARVHKEELQEIKQNTGTAIVILLTRISLYCGLEGTRRLSTQTSPVQLRFARNIFNLQKRPKTYKGWIWSHKSLNYTVKVLKVAVVTIEMDNFKGISNKERVKGNVLKTTLIRFNFPCCYVKCINIWPWMQRKDISNHKATSAVVYMKKKQW